MDTALLARLVLAHLVGDFLLQPDRWVADRRARNFRSPALYAHALVHFALAWAAVWSGGGWWIAAVVAVGHVGLDGAKAAMRWNGVRAFLADQAAHLLILALCWAGLQRADWTAAAALILADEAVLWPAAGYVAVAFFFPRLIALATRHWRERLAGSEGPLDRAGWWIGVIERVLVLTFVIIGKWEPIGFLLAAKSVLRFGDLREPRERGQTEYVLIGTLLSVGLTILLGLAVRALAHF